MPRAGGLGPRVRGERRLRPRLGGVPQLARPQAREARHPRAVAVAYRRGPAAAGRVGERRPRAALAVLPHAERHRVGVRPQRAGYLREAAAVGTRSGMRALPARRACSVLVLATSPGASLPPSASPGASGVLGMPASP